MKLGLLALTAWLALVASLPAAAALRASVDRDHVAPGQAITLTLRADGAAGAPDLSPLRKDFAIGGMFSGSRTIDVNDTVHTSREWSVTMVPRHGGVIEIPSLQAGSERSEPLRVRVDAAGATAPDATMGEAGASAAAAAANRQGKPGDAAFIDVALEPADPYVGQSVLYTLRLYYAINPIDGSLNVPASDNGDLRQIGADENSVQLVQGQPYRVLTRRYLLQPEHSGSLRIQAPVFQAHVMPTLDDPWADPGMGLVRVPGRGIDTTVRVRPAQAADPWLPARSLQLSLDAPSGQPHAGEPFSIVVRETGQGVSASQLPDIDLPAIAGAQVYPEPSTSSETVVDGQLQAQRVRRFAIVPARAGTLPLPELRVAWWDLRRDQPALARLALPTLQILPGARSDRTSGTPDSNAVASRSGPAAAAPVAWPEAKDLRIWQGACGLLALLLVLAIAWGLRRGAGARRPPTTAVVDPPSAARTLGLTQALATGDAARIAQALCAGAPGPATTQLAQVAQRLADPDQRRAVAAFEHERWQGDGKASPGALAALHVAFARGPRWTQAGAARSEPDPLPPLYPS